MRKLLLFLLSFLPGIPCVAQFSLADELPTGANSTYGVIPWGKNEARLTKVVPGKIIVFKPGAIGTPEKTITVDSAWSCQTTMDFPFFDITGDGITELIFQRGSIMPGAGNFSVMVLNPMNGQSLLTLADPSFGYGFRGIADADGDGFLELIINKGPAPYPSGLAILIYRTTAKATSTVGTQPSHPGKIDLGQNFPNPFNPNTTIGYSLPTAANVTVEIYDLNGRLIRSIEQGQQPSGHHQATWDARDNNGRSVATGSYFYQLKANGRSQVKNMLLLR